MTNESESAIAGSRHSKYQLPAVLLHWVVALMIACLLGVGWYMMSIEHEPGASWYFDQHKSFGVLLFVLVINRLVYRVGHKPPPLPDSIPGWQVKLSNVTHGLLYLCILIMPILGIIGTSYTKHGLTVFGIKMPGWAIPDHDTAEQFFDLHGTLAWVLVALIVVHGLAGLKHLFKDKDGVFQRMWF
jgi:cytochrome b561